MMIRTDADIQRLREQGELTHADEELISNCRAGKPTVLGDGKVPARSRPARRVHADLLRYLITGGCNDGPTQDVGVHLTGAYVTGTLDLKFATAKGETALLACRFECPIEALQVRLAFLDLEGSHLPGLKAVTAKVAGSVRLQHTEINGEICLGGVQIGGQLDCDNARFLNVGRVALNADSARVTSSVCLRNVFARGLVTFTGAKIGTKLHCHSAQFLNAGGLALAMDGAHVSGSVFLCALEVKGKVRKSFKAEGKVSLAGATIGGQLACQDARFLNQGYTALFAQDVTVGGEVFLHSVVAKGQVSFSAARISGQLGCQDARFDNPDGRALLAQDMIANGFIWTDVRAVTGMVDLSGAVINDLTDDRKSWDLVEDLVLYGFQYERIHQHISVTFRLEWLLSGAVYDGEFRPQPYEQLARVYKSMGHEADRRRVLIAKETLQRADERKRFSGFWGRLKRPWKWTWDSLSWLVVGYGYRPFQVISAFFILWAVGSGMAYQAWHSGGFAPNSYAVLSSPEWQVLAEDGGVDNPAEAWSAKHGAGRDWESFNSAAYAFDVVVPIVTIGQTEAWAPSKTRGAWGEWMWGMRWVLTVLGWIVTAVGAAAITGLIRRE